MGLGFVLCFCSVSCPFVLFSLLMFCGVLVCFCSFPASLFVSWNFLCLLPFCSLCLPRPLCFYGSVTSTLFVFPLVSPIFFLRSGFLFSSFYPSRFGLSFLLVFFFNPPHSLLLRLFSGFCLSLCRAGGFLLASAPTPSWFCFLCLCSSPSSVFPSDPFYGEACPSTSPAFAGLLWNPRRDMVHNRICCSRFPC